MRSIMWGLRLMNWFAGKYSEIYHTLLQGPVVLEMTYQYDQSFYHTNNWGFQSHEYTI